MASRAAPFDSSSESLTVQPVVSASVLAMMIRHNDNRIKAFFLENRTM